jgi:hypothetical protein
MSKLLKMLWNDLKKVLIALAFVTLWLITPAIILILIIAVIYVIVMILWVCDDGIY